MSHDLQMARSAEDGEINLAIGEPFFFRKLVLDHLTYLQTRKELSYPTLGGEPELISELRRLFPQYQHFVVANGAKQAIEAAFFAFKAVERKSIVFHPVPYWPSYPTLARLQGLDFNVAGPYEAQIYCVTSPNNPDGAQADLYKRMPDLWDAAYAQPLYGYHGVAPPHRVAIFSAAKYLGLSGLRVGWLATNEPELAAQAGYFVEITTSGVAIPSQMRVADAMSAFRLELNSACRNERYYEARAALMTNGASFREILGDLVRDVKGVPTDGSGMFAWFCPRRPESFARACRDAKVKVVTGEACGQPGYIRMSMGQMPEPTREALVRIRDEYFRGWVGK